MNGGGSWKVGIHGPYIPQNTYPISRLSCLNADRSIIRLFLTPEKKSIANETKAVIGN